VTTWNKLGPLLD